MSIYKSQKIEKIFLDILSRKSYIIYRNKTTGGIQMLEYKINVIKELEAVGINTTVAKNTGIFGQATMQKFRKGDTKISLDNLNRLCAVLEMQPRDIIKYVETQEDRDDYINIIHKK